MPHSMHENPSRHIAEFISKSSTPSIQSVTDFNYNISRQFVATKIRNIGTKKKKLNIRNFNENICYSLFTIHH